MRGGGLLSVDFLVLLDGGDVVVGAEGRRVDGRQRDTGEAVLVAVWGARMGGTHTQNP